MDTYIIISFSKSHHKFAFIKNTHTSRYFPFYGSGSVGSISLQDSDSDPLIFVRLRIRQKFWKTLISAVLWLLNDFLSLKSVVNVPTVSNSLYFWKTYFFGILKATGKHLRAGFVIQCTNESKDPDPSQNVTDSEQRSLSILMIVHTYIWEGNFLMNISYFSSTKETFLFNYRTCPSLRYLSLVHYFGIMENRFINFYYQDSVSWPSWVRPSATCQWPNVPPSRTIP